MKVKRLELQGFKSFKDKTVVHFDDGITGIVGPNGCGKSNIVDSFFWVMGEQSTKHMRADGQLDLIFNGSEKYSPLSMAEVTLILSTGVSEGAVLPEGTTLRDLPPHLRYSEISVTRRLYRDGHSEYMINGQVCRLKDIHELFMDTGAGPKAYSIIEQGQISKIVASKPEDRRVLVEEAAGITKFKVRKKESQRKIEATRQNLLRLNDIISEIERQLNQLERQAAKARQFKKFKEELQEKELLVGRKKLFNLKTVMGQMTARISDLEVGEVQGRTDLQTAELRIENLKIQLSEAGRLAEDAQLELQNIQKLASQDETKIQLHRQKIQELENSNYSLEEEKEELDYRISKMTDEKNTLEQEKAQLEDLFKNADQILKEQQDRFESAKKTAEELNQGLEQEKRELMASLSKQTEFSNQVHGFEARVDSLSIQLNSLNAKISTRELDCEIYSKKSQEAKTIYDQASSEVMDLRGKTNILRSETTTLDTELKQLRIDEGSAREDRTKTDSKLKALQQLVESHEGFRADVRNILKDPEFSSHLKGVFADRLEAHPGYEYALEGVLRDFLENLFVENATQAADLITALKEKSLGRATFWSYDLLEARAQAKSPIEKPPINAKVLSDVIRLDHPKATQFLNLFDHYYVVDSLSEALEAFKNVAGLGISFVTREGDVVDRYGRISGGSTSSLEGGILARKAEIQKLTEHLSLVTVKSEELSARLQFVDTTLTQKRSELDILSVRLREVEIQAKSSERDYASAESQLVLAREQLDVLKNEHQALDTERKSLWEKLDSIRHELSSMEESTRERELKIEERTRSYTQASQTAAEAQGAMVQMKVDFAAAQEKFKFATQDLQRLDQELRTSKNRNEEIERMMNRKLDEKDLLAQELEVFEGQLKNQLSRIHEVQESLRLKKNEYEKTNASMSEAFEAQKLSMKFIEETSSELSRLKLENEKSSLEYQNTYQILFEKYGLENDRIAPQNEDEVKAFDSLDTEAEAEMAIDVDKLREKIRKLGDVNVMAVEEYDEQKKRYEFLSAQREDLLQSIRDLERAIQRINKTSEERFKIAFEEINSRFQRVFPIIFGGGWGKLELTNPADLNETGLEIMVEPPGKKMSSIQLLSGGEKALTAVALIFSIFLIKPSPFCVLDEVDAPLDDHNVGKFNSLLKEMAKRSQFIVITHNKRTMELNDKLYGVTMEEPGVSKMVSIQVQ